MFRLHTTMQRRYDTQKAGRCIVNKAARLACVLIPKTASTTMRYVLGPYELLLDTNEKHHKFLQRCHIVAIVREPFSRFVSGYAEVEHRLRTPATALPILQRQSFTKIADPRRRFARFVQNAHQGGLFDQHLVQQSRHIASMRCDINAWMVFEKLATHLPQYVKQHDIKRGVPHRKRSKNKTLNAVMLDHLLKTKRLRDAVVDMYREDFTLYEKVRGEPNHEE